MLFKILHGDKSRISTDITPYHEGYCYVTHDGDFYVDMNDERVKLNARDAETLTGMSYDDIIAYVNNTASETLNTSKDYIDSKLSDLSNSIFSEIITDAEIDEICAMTTANVYDGTITIA